MARHRAKLHNHKRAKNVVVVAGSETLDALGFTEQALSEGVGKGVTYSDDLVKAAEKLYPKKVGKFELHHPFPKYMGGPEKQNLVKLPASYHQQITNEFYKYWPKKLRGQPKVYPTAQQAKEIMQKVYSKYPLP